MIVYIFFYFLSVLFLCLLGFSFHCLDGKDFGCTSIILSLVF